MLYCVYTQVGRSIAHVARNWLLTAVVRVQSQMTVKCVVQNGARMSI
jgi:hypothetical protein